MPNVFDLIKWIALIQCALIILVILLAYSLKIYSYYKQKNRQVRQKKINQILIDCVEQSQSFNLNEMKQFQRDPVLLMNSIYLLDASTTNPQWKILRKKLIEVVMVSNARIYATSSSWSHRYLACRFFEFYLPKKDEKLIISLMKDPIPVVSIAAAQLAIRVHSQHIIDAVIDIFSEGRRVQQAFYSQIMSNADPKLTVLIKNRISIEKNPYIKAFCYRTLMSFPLTDGVIETMNTDLQSDNIELKIASLTYLIYATPERGAALCIDFLKDTHWEVRAKSAQFLGKLGDESAAEALEKCLSDQQWWVRNNAAEALALLGKKGITILKRQTPQGNLSAYDAANQVLSMILPT